MLSCSLVVSCTASETQTCGPLLCPAGSVIAAISFMNYGVTVGSKGAYSIGSCGKAAVTSAIVTPYCTIGSTGCATISPCAGVDYNHCAGDPCYMVKKTLTVEITCAPISPRFVSHVC